MKEEKYVGNDFSRHCSACCRRCARIFIARKTMMNYLKKNPPINEQMIRMMMMQMGMTPSQKKINQMMKAMNNQLK